MNVLISSTELKRDLPDVVVLDCRFSLANFDTGRKLFEAGHIAGAARLDMETDLAGDTTGTNGRHPLPQRLAFQSRLRALGVNNATRVVLYDDNQFAGSARAWWLLRFWGHDNVQILDGGFKGWMAAAGDTATGKAQPVTAGTIALSPTHHMSLVDVATMKTTVANQSRVIVDSREAERFAGLQEPIDPVAGCIPGAINAPWLDITNGEGFAFDAEHQRRRWAAVTPSPDPVIYCGSGVTACVNLLSRALAELPLGTLYNGGWSEWCALND